MKRLAKVAAPLQWSSGEGRAKTPTLLQMEATECGAASLGIVLGYYRRFVPLETLREDCGITRDGSKAGNILKAARNYGLQAEGYRVEVEDLKALPLPLILFWNFNHFLVLEGIQGKKIYLNDPASGPRVVTPEVFDKSFTGVALSLVPGEEFAPGGSPKRPWKALKQRLGPVKAMLLFAVLAGLGLVLPGLLVPGLSQVFLDHVLISFQPGYFKPLLLFLGLLGLLQGALTLLQQNMLLRQEMALATCHSSRFFLHVLRLPYSFFIQRFCGEVGNRVALNDQVATTLSRQLATTLLSCSTLVFYLFVMFGYSPILSLIGVGAASVNVLLLWWIGRKRSDLNERILSDRGKFSGIAMSGLQLIETIKSTGGEDDQFSRIAGHLTKTKNAQVKMEFFNTLIEPVPSLLTAVVAACVLCLGGLQVMGGILSLGMLLAMQTLMNNFLSPVGQLVDLSSSFQTIQGTLNRLEDVLRYPGNSSWNPEKEEEEEASSPSLPGIRPFRLSGTLEVEGLTFGYSRLEPPLIENLSLHLAPGARVALVGGSGSGKSTVAKLVCGLYDPWEGAVLYDGYSRKDISRDCLARSFAFVDQDIVLYEGSIRENLTLWREGIPEEWIIQACKDVDIHEDIVARSQGYDSLVEENGRNFSGGQRQRLEIARALVMRPSLLVMDEATSALDPPTEQVVDQNLRRRGCTCLIVAHRLSTIRDSDEIILLHRGKVVERGRHEDLVALRGRYYDLIQG
jgi:NHLM bacteriocin system ABC transporter peptidase/ATP-binding protein